MLKPSPDGPFFRTTRLTSLKAYGKYLTTIQPAVAQSTAYIIIPGFLLFWMKKI